MCCRLKEIIKGLKYGNLLWYALWYAVVVLSFAFIYSVCFWCDTTSFLLSKELNAHVERYYVADSIELSSLTKEMRYDEAFTIDDLNDKVHPIVDSINRAYDQIKLLNSEVYSDSLRIESLIQKGNTERAAAIDEFKKNRVSAIDYSIDSLKRSTIGIDSTILILSGKAVELARLEYKRAVEYAKACTYVVERYSSFFPASASDSLETINHRYIENCVKIPAIKENVQIMYHDILSQSERFHTIRRESLSYWTFVYYSLGVGTTFSYGEIAPNSSCTRFWSCIELIFCICIVGLFLESLKNAINKKDDE